MIDDRPFFQNVSIWFRLRKFFALSSPTTIIKYLWLLGGGVALLVLPFYAGGMLEVLWPIQVIGICCLLLLSYQIRYALRSDRFILRGALLALNKLGEADYHIRLTIPYASFRHLGISCLNSAMERLEVSIIMNDGTSVPIPNKETRYWEMAKNIWCFSYFFSLDKEMSISHIKLTDPYWEISEDISCISGDVKKEGFGNRDSLLSSLFSSFEKKHIRTQGFSYIS